MSSQPSIRQQRWDALGTCLTLRDAEVRVHNSAAFGVLIEINRAGSARHLCAVVFPGVGYEGTSLGESCCS